MNIENIVSDPRFQVLAGNNKYASGGPINKNNKNLISQNKYAQAFKASTKQYPGMFELSEHEDDVRYIPSKIYPNLTEAVDRDIEFVNHRNSLNDSYSIPYDRNNLLELNKGTVVSKNVLDSIWKHSSDINDFALKVGLGIQETNLGMFPPYTDLSEKERQFYRDLVASMDDEERAEYYSDHYNPASLFNNHNYFISPIRGDLNTLGNVPSKSPLVYGTPMTDEDNGWRKYNTATSELFTPKNEYRVSKSNDLKNRMKELYNKTDLEINLNPWDALDSSIKYNRFTGGRELMEENKNKALENPVLREYIKNKFKK